MTPQLRNLLYKGHQFDVRFYRTSQGKCREGNHRGETTYGYTSYADSMSNARAVAECLWYQSSVEDVMVTLTMDGWWLGDFPLANCY